MVNKNQGLVSVIMNCHNGEKYLEEALLSLKKQTYKNFELIFFDNFSQDKTKFIFNKYRDKRFKYFYSKKKINLGKARKLAYTKAKGKFIAFLDSDDYWHKNKLKKQVYLLSNRKYGLALCNSYFFNKNIGKPFYKKPFEKGYRFYDLIKNYNISFDAVMFRKEYIDKLEEGFSEKYNIIHDLDLIIRLSYIYEINYIHELLSYWRMHEGSDSYLKMDTINGEKKKFIKIISKKFLNDKLFQESKVLFMKNIYYEELIHNIIKNKKKISLKLILKLKGYKKTLLLLPILLIPFGSYLFKRIYLKFKFFVQ